MVYPSTKQRGWKKALDEKGYDLVVAAGGEGTVGQIARQLIGRETPLSVLPLGTANNLARTLGFTGTVAQLIGRVGQGEPRGFAVGVARGPWGKRHVFEGLGAGLLGEYLRRPRRKKEKKRSREGEMRWHVRRLRKLLAEQRPHAWEIEVDGDKLEGCYLPLEAMNICSVGPVLNLAAGARTSDGRFNLVLARENERKILME